jgi:endonuclease YncB( thermonuclease family)
MHYAQLKRRRMKFGFYVKTGIITGLMIFIVFAAGVFVKNYNEQKSIQRFDAVVQRVIDGDTVVLDSGEKVRLLGIDSPELHHPDYPVQKYGEEAKQYMKKRVEGKKVTLEYTVLDKYDKYNRLLAFIYLDGANVNSEMVKKGLAYASVNQYMSKTKEFMVIENIARRFKVGIWETEEGGQVKK